MKTGRCPFRFGLILIGALLWLATPQEGGAQNTDQPLQVIEPPVGSSTDGYVQSVRGSPVRTEAIYSDDPEFGPGQEVRIRRARRERDIGSGPRVSMDSGLSVALSVLVLLTLLLIWLKFGGSGMLLSGAPREMSEKRRAPESWAMVGDGGPIDGRVLISRLRAMADRQEALVLLLRHSLLAAAEVSGTRFARADTEREAFARIPRTWQYRAELSGLLRTTELVHYGGRPVDDAAFEDALSKGERILMTGKGLVHA